MPFLAAGIALTVSMLLVVAAFASLFANAIQERNTFVVAPFFLIALLVWIDRGAPRPRVYAVVAACVAAVLPALIPYERFLQLKVRSDTLMIVPLWNVQDHVGLPRLDEVVLLGVHRRREPSSSSSRAATLLVLPGWCWPTS